MNRLQKIKMPKTAKKNIVSAIVMAIFSMITVVVVALIFTARKQGIAVLKTNMLSLLWLSIFLFALLMVFYFYIYYQRRSVYDSNKDLTVILTIIFITVITTFSTMRYASVYAVPIAMCGVLVGILVSHTLGFIANAFISVIVSVLFLCMQFLFDGAVDINALLSIQIAMLQGYGMMFMVKRNYTRFKLLWGALAMGFVFSPIAVFTGFATYGYTIEVLYAVIWCFVGNAIGVGIFTAILPIYESLFNVWTNFNFAEACSMSRPLLKRLSTEAGGTFNHSVTVSNIAESCALAIGENPYLAKACGMYHDVGKLKNAEYFIENQNGGYNPHDDLIPEQSVKIITSHTNYGYKLLKEYHMPESVARVAIEHHGTTPVTYFYNKAQNISESALDKTHFTYSGPKPTSKIAAIVMIVDIVEASTRSQVPNDMDELATRIDAIIATKIKEGQFSDCDITFQDLEKIKATIIKVIPGIFHKRISYNNAK